jgi:hypothetical protein
MKHQKGGEEQEEAAKNQALVVESSIKLTAILNKFSAAFVVRRGNKNASIDDKLNQFKYDLFQQLDAREQAVEARIASKLDEKFGDCVRFLRGG